MRDCFRLCGLVFAVEGFAIVEFLGGVACSCVVNENFGWLAESVAGVTSWDSFVLDKLGLEVQKGDSDAEGPRGPQRCSGERAMVLLESGLPYCSSWIFNIRAPKHALLAFRSVCCVAKPLNRRRL